MAASHWKLIASTLGSDANAREVVVEGKNWLHALRSARSALGEPGGVPTGASCVMNADGGVTILDAATRSRYELRPTEAPLSATTAAAGELLRDRAATDEPPARAESAAAPASSGLATSGPALPNEPAATAAPVSSLAPPAAVALPAPRINAAALPAAAPAATSPGAEPALPARGERADPRGGTEDPQPGSGVRPARAGSTPGLPGVSETPSQPVATPSQPPSSTAAAPSSEHPAAAPPRRQPTRPPRPESARGLPISPPPEALRPIAPFVPPAAAAGAPAAAPLPAAAPRPARASGVAAGAPTPPSAEASGASPPLVLIAARDEDPRPQSPLTYRERSYVAAPGARDEDVELGLRLALARLQDELRGAPRGQLVNLAVFDHVFNTAPQRGPIATLQWKDWRGEPTFERQPSEPFGVGADGQLRPSQYPPTSPSAFPPATTAPAAAQQAGPSPSQPLAPARPARPSQPAMPAAPVVRPVVAPDPFAAFPFASAAPVAGAPAPGSTRPSAPDAPPPPFAMTQPAPPPAPGDPGTFAHAPLQAPTAPRPVRATLDYTQIAAARQGESHGGAPLPAQGADATGEQDRRLAHAFEAAQDLYFLATPAAGLEFVVKLLGELLPSEACAASLYDINTDQLRCVAAVGPGAEARRAGAVATGAGLLSVAAKSRSDHLVVNAIDADPRFEREVDGFGEVAVRELAYFPMTVGIQLVGMLQLVNRRGRPGFSEADVAVGAYLASQAAQFVLDQRSRRNH